MTVPDEKGLESSWNSKAPEELTPLPIAYDLYTRERVSAQGEKNASVGDWKCWLMKGNFLKSYYVTMFVGSFD